MQIFRVEIPQSFYEAKTRKTMSHDLLMQVASHSDKREIRYHAKKISCAM